MDHPILGQLVAHFYALGELDLFVLSKQRDRPGFLHVEPKGIGSNRLDRKVQSGLRGLKDTLGARTLLIDLDRLIEELRV